MVGGVISDIYNAQDRNAPMSCFSGSALFGTGLGPLVSGFIEMRVSWRWIFYSQAIASAVFMVILLVFLKETRGSVLLSRKAKAINRYYEKLEDAGYYGVVFGNGVENYTEKEPVQRIRWKVKADEERETLVKMISISCYRPFRKLISLYSVCNLDIANGHKISWSPSRWSSSSRCGWLSVGPFYT